MTNKRTARLQNILHHVLLPPKLPNGVQDDLIRNASEEKLLSMAITYSKSLAKELSADVRKECGWPQITKMLSNLHTTILPSSMDAKALSQMMLQMHTKDVIVLPIRAQNAVLMIRRYRGYAQIECYENAARHEDTLECHGRLQRKFPAYGVKIPENSFFEPLFMKEFTTWLCSADLETVAEMQQPDKNDSSGVISETTAPALVTELLMALLAAKGEPVPVSQITKHIRDDVLSTDSGKSWRRSYLWLVIRVAIQSTLFNMAAPNIAHAHYKNFMITLIAELAELSGYEPTLGDLSRVATMKLSRRVKKLGDDILDHVRDRALAVCKNIDSNQRTQWEQSCREDADRPFEIDVRDFTNDTQLTLTRSRPYIEGILKRDVEMVKPNERQDPSCIDLLTFDDEVPILHIAGFSTQEKMFAFAEVEFWVRHRLEEWTQDRLDTASADHCDALSRLSASYLSEAALLQQERGLSRSNIIFTVALLWYSLDRMVLKETPLLEEYSPEMQPSVFSTLLLPTFPEMEQLQTLELYLAGRIARAKKGHSLFNDPEKSNSFYARWFETSPTHKQLKKHIEKEANEARYEKECEFNRLNAEYNEKKERVQSMDCDMTDADDFEPQHDSATCSRCNLDAEADAMQIEAHEWPLPENDRVASAVVVELDCPKQVVAWRNTTWLLLHRIGRSCSGGLSPEGSLEHYRGLTKHFATQNSIITLASKAKINENNPKKRFPTTLEQCYIATSASYHYYDVKARCWVASQTAKSSYLDHVTPKLPDGPYQYLQYAVSSTHHSQNRVIADLEHCSLDSTLHDFRRYGSLRADGERIQWWNIARELRARNMDFNAPEVVTLFVQAALQAGSPAETAYRNSHLDLEEPNFGTEILYECQLLLRSVKDNWKCDNTLKLITTISSRVLSLSKDPDVINFALTQLRETRLVTWSWIKQLSEALSRAREASQIRYLSLSLLRAGLLCKSTFGVDARYFPHVFSEISDICAWFCASKYIRDNIPHETDASHSPVKTCIENDQRLSQLCLHGILASIASGKYQGLDNAVRHLLAKDLASTGRWVALSAPSQRWVMKVSTDTADSVPMTYHLNLLDGDILINGERLSRLPPDYIADPSYKSLFENQILPVMPSGENGFRYRASNLIHGYAIHFNMEYESVIIQLHQSTTPRTILEIIPTQCIVQDLPNALTKDMVHLFNIQTRQIEIRPRSSWWDPSTTKWIVQIAASSYAKACDVDKILVDMESLVHQSVSAILAGLDVKDNIVVTYSEDMHILEVDLSRYNLHFQLLDSGELLCKELGKIVDSNQDAGCFIGLQNRLILCGISSQSRKLERMIVVPKGKLRWFRSDSDMHQTVRVDLPDDANAIDLVKYEIDATTQGLKCQNDSFSLVYKAYLHAVSSHFLADPLTGHTGVEEAIQQLRQRSLRFMQPCDEEVREILTSLSKLSPGRKYATVTTRLAQEVLWDSSLSMFVQHDDYADLAEILIDSGSRFTIFHARNGDTKPTGPSSARLRITDLVKRAKHQWSVFRQPGLLSNSYKGHNEADREYIARDVGPFSERAEHAYRMALLTDDESQPLKVTGNLLKSFRTYGTMSGFHTNFDSRKTISELLQLPMKSSWGPLRHLLLDPDLDIHRTKIMFLLGTIAYGKGIEDLEMLVTLLAILRSPRLRALELPEDFSHFQLSQGYRMNTEKLEKKVREKVTLLRSRTKGRKRGSAAVQEEEQYADEIAAQTTAVTNHYVSEWKCAEPEVPSPSIASHLNLDRIHDAVTDMFSLWISNEKYTEYCKNAQPHLNTFLTEEQESEAETNYIASDWQISTPIDVGHRCSYAAVTLPRLLEISIPPPISRFTEFAKRIPGQARTKNAHLTRLLRDNLHTGSSEARKKLLRSIAASVEAWDEVKEVPEISGLPCSPSEASQYLQASQDRLKQATRTIGTYLQPLEPADLMRFLSGLWPGNQVKLLLKLLSSNSASTLSTPWRNYIVHLGTLVTCVQRAQRLVLAIERNDAAASWQEIANAGHSNWDPLKYPEWLLLEIENNIMIRPVQATIAIEMLNPSIQSNCTIQLNMGEGKSSVIVPMIALATADKTRLARIVVLKSLRTQMTVTLRQRLGGLLDRPLYSLPFNRALHVDISATSQIQRVLEECKSRRGVLIAQPEHILSFRLLGIERSLGEDATIGRKLIDTQKWLDENVRDTLDECDELLDVKFQLIYSLGTQKMMDGQPHRWIVVQTIFDLLKHIALKLQRQYPKEFETQVDTEADFPSLKPLTQHAEKELVENLTHAILESQLPGLSLESATSEIKSYIRRFIQDRELDAGISDRISKHFAHQDAAFNILLQIRGLISHGVLLHMLKTKRWFVNYGLHNGSPEKHCLSAVPYRAKGVPAQNSEFGHPDVAIILTCLSYYYGGLNTMQAREIFLLLEKAEDPSGEYAAWTRDCQPLYRPPKDWSAINLDDESQFEASLVPAVRYNKRAIDFYLSKVVFPREGKEFDLKLSGSAWDLAVKRTHITTGFSGTNDNQFIMPDSIVQNHIGPLRHTSAMVLDWILKPQNLEYHCFQTEDRRRVTLKDFLAKLFTHPRVTILIDVGAQILGCSNKAFAAAWLETRDDAKAALYFDQDDVAMILSRDGKSEELTMSPFRNSLKDCLVFMDEVHTRGTDLKLSPTARAAVTLGPRLSKDRLVQACMRLRSLSDGQSLMFVAPPEVDVELANRTGANKRIDGYDVISWCLEQSCSLIEQAQALLVMQGLNFVRRQLLDEQMRANYTDSEGHLQGTDELQTHLQEFVEQENQSLVELYAPAALKERHDTGILHWAMSSNDHRVQDLYKRWKAQERQITDAAILNEEHEREISHEVERETQIERPMHVEPLDPQVDDNLLNFINSGTLEDFVKFKLAYDHVITNTSLKSLGSNRHPWYRLRATTDFVRTVQKPSSGGPLDNFLRPVNFIITNKDEGEAGTALLISPFEANAFLREIQANSSHVELYMYEPRVTRNMRSVDTDADSISTLSVENWNATEARLRRELHMFAGQLYFTDYKDYKEARDRDLGRRLNRDVDQTLSFLHQWLAIRGMGRDFSKTHMGYLASGRTLSEETFD